MTATYSLGDTLPFSLLVYDGNGNLANGGTVTLSVVQPDGTSAGPFPVTATTTGTYNYAFTTAQYGRHLGEWTVTGANAGGEPQAFYVQSPAPLMTVAEVKRHLDLTTTTDDDEIAAFIGAVVLTLEGIAGPIVPRSISLEAHDAGAPHIWTDFTPIVSVQSLTEVIGYTQFTLTNQPVGAATDMYGYTIDDAREGRITRRGVGSQTLNFGWAQSAMSTGIKGTVLISYTAGRSAPSVAVQMAAKELLRYMWRQVHGNPQSFTDSFVPQAAMSGVSQAMMDRLKLILGPTETRPLGVA